MNNVEQSLPNQCFIILSHQRSLSTPSPTLSGVFAVHIAVGKEDLDGSAVAQHISSSFWHSISSGNLTAQFLEICLYQSDDKTDNIIFCVGHWEAEYLQV